MLPLAHVKRYALHRFQSRRLFFYDPAHLLDLFPRKSLGFDKTTRAAVGRGMHPPRIWIRKQQQAMIIDFVFSNLHLVVDNKKTFILF